MANAVFALESRICLAFFQTKPRLDRTIEDALNMAKRKSEQEDAYTYSVSAHRLDYTMHIANSNGRELSIHHLPPPTVAQPEA